ncbi:endonuclease/exonuclease/phosphatase family protein [Vibrio cholerae]|nr:endonuclease/exonuclease/phosphatase family protein [Vibrio cholerae]
MCEVSSSDVAELANRLSNTPLKVLDLSFKAGQTRFDTAIVYNPNIFTISHQSDIKNIYRGQTVKAGQHVILTEKVYNEQINVILCHWASSINSSGEDKRLRSADIIYREACNLMSKGERVIIMGDFNDNPYDESMFRRLNATRCHESIKRHPNELLYNPFWRNVVSHIQYNYTKAVLSSFPSGSHKYRSPLGEAWHTYDQILFSGNFLGTGNWHLNEPQTKSIDDKRFLNSILSNLSIFDHLPVMCEITRP